MIDTLDSPDQPELKKYSRPGLITMAVLTFIGGLFKISIAALIVYEIFSRKGNYPLSPEKLLVIRTCYAIFLHALILFTGVILMLYRRMTGLYVYLGAQLFIALVFSYSWFGTNRRLHVEEIAFMGIIYFGILLFCLLYVLFRKQIRRKRPEIN